MSNKYSNVCYVLYNYFAITYLFLIIDVSCSVNCEMFLIKCIEILMHDHRSNLKIDNPMD